MGNIHYPEVGTTRDILHQFAKQKLKPGQEFSIKDAVDWFFAKGYRKTKPKTIYLHVRGMAINLPSARKYINGDKAWNLFWHIDKDRFRPLEPKNRRPTTVPA